ncbi:hypothetical protein EB796_004310 [Bugula neritina]|uniref:Uncharacterized protein n=1 Tax=Bugula neritina TaxID=10212 RepID=A0A7J7KJ09_BUGNE|nr:hypothetical protein EB796_004310 [Bugula neritina]
MSQPPNYVRCDTPDPRAGTYQFDVSPPTCPSIDISAPWQYYGTNSSALKGQPLAHAVPTEFKWTELSPSLNLQTRTLYSDGRSGVRQKRHWQSTDDRFSDDPPCKIHVDEQRMAQQFHSMSLQQDKSKSANSNSSMWDHFYELENRLNDPVEADVDEGVDMGGDANLTSQTKLSEPKLLISADLQEKIKRTPLPQIMVPKPCKELVLWQPSGIEQIKEAVILQTSSAPSLPRDSTSQRVRKNATRSLLTAPSLLSVPAVRPDTPPPNTSKSPLSQDIPVCFVDDDGMDL